MISPDAAPLSADEIASLVQDLVAGGSRLSLLMATAEEDRSTLLRAVMSAPAGLCSVEARMEPGVITYPSVAATVPAAAWYERELHDTFGLDPVGHPRLEPLLLPRSSSISPPRPGGLRGLVAQLEPDPDVLPARATGEGLFTIPYGPVRSGVFESVEYLLETFGEDIPHVRARVYHKHRGVETRFEGLAATQGSVVAERVEGPASVAHAWAYALAVESLSDTPIPETAQLIRLLHAETERIVNHLESVIRHAEAAAQAVAYARLTVHKERLMRLRARLCGHRFGRGVIIPGGVAGPLGEDPRRVGVELEALARAIGADLAALMATPSFVDRLRGTGVLPPDLAGDHGALGPVGRGSGVAEDIRVSRPYGFYGSAGARPADIRPDGDALARQRVRTTEIDDAFALARWATERLAAEAGSTHVPIEVRDGVGMSEVEAPSGQLIYVVEVRDGCLERTKPRCPSFHNLAIFPAAFRGDILTDFAFIEASFGLLLAGVSV